MKTTGFDPKYTSVITQQEGSVKHITSLQSDGHQGLSHTPCLSFPNFKTPVPAQAALMLIFRATKAKASGRKVLYRCPWEA